MGAFRRATTNQNPDAASLNSEVESVAVNSSLAEKKAARLSDLILTVRDKRVRTILEMIESQPSTKIQYLAVRCNLSESRLQHLFKQWTGMGLGQLLTEQRLQQASDSLTHTSMSIKEIASAAGYEHASSFTRAFERRFRQPPSCYRETQRGEFPSTRLSLRGQHS